MPAIESSSYAHAPLRPLPEAIQRVLTHRLEGAIQKLDSLGRRRRRRMPTAASVEAQQRTLLAALDDAAFERGEANTLNNRAQRLSGRLFAGTLLWKSPRATAVILRALLARLPDPGAATESERIGLYDSTHRTVIDFGYSVAQHVSAEAAHMREVAQLRQGLSAMRRRGGDDGAAQTEFVYHFERLTEGVIPLRPLGVLHTLAETAESFTEPKERFLAALSFAHAYTAYPSLRSTEPLRRVFGGLRAHPDCAALLEDHLEMSMDDEAAPSPHRALRQGVAAIRDEPFQARLAEVLIDYFPRDDAEAAFTDILAMTANMTNFETRASLLPLIAMRLPSENASTHFTDLCRAMAALVPHGAHIDAWLDLAEHTPPMPGMQARLLGRALEVLNTYRIDDVCDAVRRALANCGRGPDGEDRRNALGRFASAIPDREIRRRVLRAMADVD